MNKTYIILMIVFTISIATQLVSAAENINLIESQKVVQNRYEEWNETFGVTISSAQQTNDGGYILTGYDFYECGIDIFDSNTWLVKIDSHGNHLWSKKFGDTSGDINCASYDIVYSVQQTNDGGYILAGYTKTYGTGFFESAWAIKTDSQGNEQWNKTFGGTDTGSFQFVQQTVDGGYIFAGWLYPNGLLLNGLLLKTDSQGNEQWNKTFGQVSLKSVRQTKDGGYVIIGGARIIKTDNSGKELWNKTFEGTDDLGPYLFAGFQSVQQTKDGGYILSGQFYGDAWLMKTDSQGKKLWNKTFGNKNIYYETATSVQETIDGGYVLAGYTGYRGAEAWMVKTDNRGNRQWDIYYDSINTPINDITAIFVQQTKDGGYILVGNTELYDIHDSHLGAFIVKLGVGYADKLKDEYEISNSKIS